MFGLGGHQDYLPACLARILYCILAEQQYNLAYFFVKRIKNARATPIAHLPYGMFLTCLFRHVMEHYPHLDNGIYDVIERVMRPLFLRQARRPRCDRGKACHSVSSTSAHHNRESLSHQGEDDKDDVIKEYLVKVNKRHAFWNLNEDMFKITILKTNTPYPSRRYGVSVPELTKYHEGNKPISRIQKKAIRRIEDTCMTRSSTNKLFTPYKEPEREFRSSRRHFKTLSLDELRSPDFNILSDQEYSEEEKAKAMVETMEQYVSKTRTDYGSGVARPKIKEKDSFELKGQFLKELQENTFSGLDNEVANVHIEKVLKIVDLFHVPNITEVILFYNGLDIPTRLILDSRGAIPTMTAANAKMAIQKMVEYSQKSHNGTSRGRSNKTSDGLAAIQA
ncbi:hypothetical protein Tco_0840535 [Tanacetum coccineum]|uniref:Uncharacterized protein n=1 Tax=Tanacetum coccineum TaxID=301880 RepID=A0ABQ5AXE3_9ASTR